MTAESRTVAIVEDDDLVRSATASLVRSLGLATETFPSAVAFLSQSRRDFGCIISDVQMPEMSGLDLQEALRDSGVSTPMIIMTAYPTDAMRDRAEANGAKCFLEKPCDPDVIADCLSQVFGPLES